ncbi:hypothetical protein BDQ17DRAFT_1335296 [Cyathus striatus]|nr:hypothetical protein BDQ17DRAFT_1335296 [Cyathus striatus]
MVSKYWVASEETATPALGFFFNRVSLNLPPPFRCMNPQSETIGKPYIFSPPNPHTIANHMFGLIAGVTIGKIQTPLIVLMAFGKSLSRASHSQVATHYRSGFLEDDAKLRLKVNPITNATQFLKCSARLTRLTWGVSINQPDQNDQNDQNPLCRYTASVTFFQKHTFEF